MKLSLVVQTAEVEGLVPVALLSGSLSEKLAKAARFGADGVELMTVDPSRIPLDALRKDLQRNRLQVAAVASGALSMVSGLTLLNADTSKAARAFGRLKDLVLFAEDVGAPVVTIGSFRGRLSPGGPSGRELLIKVLQEADTFAASRGVCLALEPLNRYEADLINNVEEGLKLLDETGRPSLGLVLDTFHVNIEERSWDGPFSRALQEGRLLHVHLGDNNRLAPGLGMIDFRRIIKALCEGGYGGYLSAELLPWPDADEAARLTIAHVRGLLDG
jgi:sugar phosphate isomerase/epimerase